MLKHLNPKPGAQFTAENMHYVVPDIIVELGETGEYEVRLLDDWTPNIYISKRYIEHVPRPRRRSQGPRISQAQDPGGAVADRGDRAAAQHPGQGDAGDHPAPEGRFSTRGRNTSSR